MKYLISILALITVPVQVMAFTTALRRARVLSTRTSTIVSNFIPVRPRILSREKGWLLRMSSGKDSSDTFEKEMRQKQSEANEKVSSASSTSSSFSTNEEHAEHQSAVFDEEASFFASRKNIPDEVVPVLRNMAETVLFGTIAMRDRLTTREKELIPARSERLTHEEGVYHILDVGCGTGALFDYYLEAAAKSQTTVHIHGLDLSPRMVEQARIHGEHLLKDEKLTANRKHSIRVEEGDICEWKPEQQYDLVVANACFGNFYDPPKALEKMADATRPDGWVCITHPLGSDFVRKLHEDNSTVVPHLLPTFSEYRKMARTLPLHVLGVVDKQDESFPLPSFYMASALKTVHRTLPETIRLRGPVAEGYGRGGKKLGFPTANLPVSMFQEALEDLPCGVYFGWAVLEDPEKKKKGRNIPLKAVVNIGFSPTFEGQENKEKVVEAHIIPERNKLDPPDFYGETMRLQLSGFIRGEIKFPDFKDLIDQITTDVQDTKDALNFEVYQTLQRDVFLSDVNKKWIGSGGGDSAASWEFEDVESALERSLKQTV